MFRAVGCMGLAVACPGNPLAVHRVMLPRIRCRRRAEDRHRGWRRTRWCLPRRPWPHRGAIPVQTRDMERDLRLVREGHRDGVAVHGVRAPHTGADRVRLPPPRTFDLCHAAALSALRCGHTFHTPATGNASRTRRGACPRSLGSASGKPGAARSPVTLGKRAYPSWWTGEYNMKERDATEDLQHASLPYFAVHD